MGPFSYLYLYGPLPSCFIWVPSFLFHMDPFLPDSYGPLSSCFIWTPFSCFIWTLSLVSLYVFSYCCTSCGSFYYTNMIFILLLCLGLLSYLLEHFIWVQLFVTLHNQYFTMSESLLPAFVLQFQSEVHCGTASYGPLLSQPLFIPVLNWHTSYGWTPSHIIFYVTLCWLLLLVMETLSYTLHVTILLFSICLPPSHVLHFPVSSLFVVYE